MKVIKPVTVDDSVFYYSSAPGEPPTAWDAGTNYQILSGVNGAVAQRASVAGSAGYVACYKTLANGNAGHPPATSPGWWEFIGGTYQEYSSAAIYAMGDRVVDSVNHLAYESLIDGNTGVLTTSRPQWSSLTTAEPPVISTTSSTLADPLKWLELGATNDWLMLDQTTSSQTIAPKNIRAIADSRYADGVALFGLAGQTITIQLHTIAGSGAYEFPTYDQTFDLDRSVFADVYDWFVVPFEQIDRVAVTGISPVSASYLSVSLDTTGTAAIGTMVWGGVVSLGGTQAGAGLSIIDYSRKETDAYGGTTFARRAFAEKLNCKLYFNNAELPSIHAALADLRATPCAWLGVDLPDFTPLNIYGWYRDFSINVAYQTTSFCSLEIEGIT